MRVSLGALVGDYMGSCFEKKYQIPVDTALPSQDSRFTDDSVLTVATADALKNGHPFADVYRKYYAQFPQSGFGRGFIGWATNVSEKNDSFGNGSAMRVSPIAWFSNDLPQVLKLAQESAVTSHNHADGIKGAQAAAAFIFYSRTGMPKQAALQSTRAYFDLKSYDLSAQRQTNTFVINAVQTVELALECVARSHSFEEAVRFALYLGGDVDTLAAIAGSMAEAYHPIPQHWVEHIRGKAQPGWLELLSWPDAPTVV